MVLQLSSQCKVKKYGFEEDIFGNLKKVLKEKVILNWNFGKSKCLPFLKKNIDFICNIMVKNPDQ